MQFAFRAVLAIFSNQDMNTLDHQVTNVLGPDGDYARVELSTKNDLQRVAVTVTNEDDDIVGDHKFLVVPVTPTIIKQIRLAIEDGKVEEEQREMWGDEVIDWINTVSRNL